jgi:8-oxo-dGTP pyrophosphatase MutT (NUDIX family)
VSAALPPYSELVGQVRSRLDGRPRHTIHIEDFRAAAVALLLREDGGQAWVPVTRRAPHLDKHSNQLSLPGGVRDLTDASLADTACREAYEEIGIDPARIEVLGLLDDVVTPTGFVITPVIGVLAGAADYHPNPDEVAEVFEVPLAAFTEPGAREDHGTREIAGRSYRVISYQWQGRRIWGATARVFEMLIDTLGE